MQPLSQSSPERRGGYFFCGIGGSGMLPLAQILHGQGYKIYGSDRSFDQGRTAGKFKYIEAQGIVLFPQDGSGLKDGMTLVVSTAVESSIPDVQRALELGLPIIKRAELLAEIFNAAETRIAIAGTSGKSTTTGMLGFVLQELGSQPTVMNGAVFKNFVTDTNPFATALAGRPDLFVTEADESDGSIALYQPTIAVLNNSALDHKGMDELEILFTDFLDKAESCVLNLDNQGVAQLAESRRNIVTYSLNDMAADLYASDIITGPDGLSCQIGNLYLRLNIPGRHNLSNALACLSCLKVMGQDLQKSCEILARFSGVQRRLDIVGRKNEITVIDDFAHNPDKIAATLQTLKEFNGRLLIVFQMHGFGPMKLLRQELQQVFQDFMNVDDKLYMPEILYLGGTADRSYTAKDFIGELAAAGTNAQWFEQRADILPELIREARPGDRILVMGARDDTLTEFAKDILAAV